MITEVFISIDGENYTKLDLHKDENISMKYTQKDLQDISKIFSPYSMSFTFPATPKNRAAFGFFGDTDVIKINTENKFACKIYTDGVLNLTGFILLSDLKYKNNVPTDFTGNFATSMTNLKDRIGDALIGDLATERLKINWTPNTVYSLLQGANNTTIDGVNVSYFVPLISSNRVLGFNSNIESGLKDNVAYDSAVTPTSNGTIKSYELRPCLSFSSIIELIKKKYNLSVICPLDERPEYKDLFIWCNSETMLSNEAKKMTLKQGFGGVSWYDSKNEGDIPDPKKYVGTTSLSDNSFKVIKQRNENEWDKFFSFKIALENVLITGNSSASSSINVTLVRKSDNIILASKQIDLVAGKFSDKIQINDSLFVNNEIEFYVYVQFNQPTSWTNATYGIEFKYYDGKYGPFNSKRYATYQYQSLVNNNAVDILATNIDLFKTLPSIKVIDFLTSYFKMFNISVFDTSPNDENLYWLTPEDVQTSKKAYSKSVLDYTAYVNASDFKKSTASDYNYYNFKHADSKYKSNVDYLSQTGFEYGQAVNPLVKPANPREFVVQTTFTLMVPVILNGTSDVVTYYGFDNSSPEILPDGEARYTPNYGELTIFYNYGNTPISSVLGVQNNNTAGTLLNSPLNNYMKVLPWNKNLNSLGFSNLKFQDVVYDKSLYSKYYSAQTTRLLNPNVLSQEYSLILPSNEIYLNDSNSFQGQGETPTGFRLQNDIIIAENLFTILDATIDITTGKTKITLLNF